MLLILYSAQNLIFTILIYILIYLFACVNTIFFIFLIF